MQIKLPQFSPLAKTWLTAQGIGTICLIGVKIFRICNPQLGFAIGTTVYLANQLARCIFRQLIDDRHAISEFATALFWSTACLHIFVHLACPNINIISADIAYIFFKTAGNLAYATGKAVWQVYGSKAK